jgi:hypothetical protein
MADFIRREDALKVLCNNYAYAAMDVIKRLPAADVAEVVHGQWLRADDDWNSLTTIQCSLCSEEWCFETDDDVSLLNYKYCPNCGAKMDGGNGDATD